VFPGEREALLEPGDGEQVVDQPSGAVTFAQDLQDEFLAGGAVGAGAQQCFRAGLHGGDRGAQLVGGVGQEAAHAFVGVAQGPGFDDREPADDDEQAQADQAGAEEDLPRCWRLGQQDG
jgi:hypothetical protein